MIFISPNEHQKLYFHEWRSQPLVKIQLLVFMSEIIINITPKKNQIFCFIYAKMWRKLTFSDRQPSLQKTNFFPSHYTCRFYGVQRVYFKPNIECKRSLHLENSFKCQFNKWLQRKVRCRLSSPGVVCINNVTLAL